MRNKKLLALIACVLAVLLVITAIVVSAIKQKNKKTALPNEQTTEEQQQPVDTLPVSTDSPSTPADETNEAEETDIGAIPFYPPIKEQETEPDEDTPDIILDVIRENEEYRKEVNPTVEGEVIIEDGEKEVGE